MSWRNFPRDYLRRTTPAGAVIKWKAHAATVATAALIVPSLCAVYFWHAGTKEDEPYWIWASIMVWRIHAVVSLIALLFWLFEKPRSMSYVRDNTRGWSKVARNNPRATMIALAITSLFFGWMAVLKIEVAWSYWRWGSTGRAIGHTLGALPILLLAAAAGVGPVAIVVVKCRAFFGGAPKA